MGALGTMRDYSQSIADSIAMVYIEERLNKGIELDYVTDGDVEIEHKVDIDKGIVTYRLKGLWGDSINNPDVNIGLLPDLLRGLRRSEAAYNRHIKNIANGEEIAKLVRETLTTIKLLKVEEKYDGEQHVAKTATLGKNTKILIEDLKKLERKASKKDSK